MKALEAWQNENAERDLLREKALNDMLETALVSIKQRLAVIEGLHAFWAQVTIAALLQREHRRWLDYGGLNGPGSGEI